MKKHNWFAGNGGGRGWFFGLAVASALLPGVTAEAELALTNYTPANPLKVLAIGDSITDDSVTNGAWRSFLQKLLATNGYNFTNLGRWSSVPFAGFTQVHHEGMDGSVIGSPGVSGPTHGYPALENYALFTVPQALTTASPDLVLIDLGVNDMGHGRDPVHTSMSDLFVLLDDIYAVVPDAHVIISKPTTITYSTILTPPYDTYGSNMFAFCDGVQALAAEWRAQGQDVFVADLFSAVNGATMLNSDGTHPNSIGLSAIASEMMFRIAAITSRPDYVTTPFVLGGSVWNYSDQGLDLGTNWSQPNFDDSAWSQGAGRLGYNIFGITSTVGYGPDPSNKYVTTYFRNRFVVPNGVIYTNLGVRLNCVDGAVVWLNGKELYRVNLPAGPLTYQTQATQSVDEIGDPSNTYNPTNEPIAFLPAGTNVIAVEIHKSDPGNAGITFDLELFGNGVFPPNLSVTAASGALQLAWPTSAAGFSLQTATNLPSAGAWQNVSGPYPQSNGSYKVSVPINADSAQFFRLIKPGT